LLSTAYDSIAVPIADRPHIGHGPLLLASVDRVQQVRDRDGRDNPDDRHDDQQLDQGETFLILHLPFLL
jgi:hypothetical protein